MSFIEDYSVIINQNNIFYRRLGIKKMLFNRIRKEELNDGMIVPFPDNGFYFSVKSKTHTIAEDKKFSRAGVIPYTISDNKRYFCLAVDSKYGTLTDFGGGVKKGENFVVGACRELEEESLGIFDFTSKENLEKVRQNSVTVHDSSLAVIFLQVKVDDMNQITQLFKERYLKTKNPENSNIVWIPEDVFFYLIKSGRTVRNGKHYYPSVYKIVNDLLRSISNINEIF